MSQANRLPPASLRNRLFYFAKPLIPRSLQLALRRHLILRKRKRYSDVWPILEEAGRPPQGWRGWPDGKQFALVLTHDVDTAKGHDNCLRLADLEESLGFRSSFNFVPERYKVSSSLREELSRRGFEIGVHGLVHDGKLFSSRKIFEERAEKINAYLEEWCCSGFRSPAMHHNLEWIGELNVKYDASTFDTDPFEPQPDGVGTIFPFAVYRKSVQRSSHELSALSFELNDFFIELPYTLPQDFTLFILMKEKDSSIWRRKLEWIAGKGGMALVNIHPDYLNFGDTKLGREEYPARYYRDFLEFAKNEFQDDFWHSLPRDLALFVSRNRQET
jgi:hypothetical protein